MFSVPSELAAELQNEIAFLVYLLEFQFDNHLYYNNSDEPIHYENHVYEPWAFEISPFRTSSSGHVDSVTISIDDVGQDFAGIFLNEENRGRFCVISLAALDDNVNVLGKVDIFTGLIDTVKLTKGLAQITVSHELAFWRKQTLRNYSPLCPWRFKDEFCQYNGNETWCDGTYKRCKELGNTAHFGGFRYIPSITEAEIWWGKASQTPSGVGPSHE